MTAVGTLWIAYRIGILLSHVVDAYHARSGEEA